MTKKSTNFVQELPHLLHNLMLNQQKGGSNVALKKKIKEKLALKLECLHSNLVLPLLAVTLGKSLHLY